MKITTLRNRPSRTEQMLAETASWVPTGQAVAGKAVAGSPLLAGMSRHEIDGVLGEFDEVRFPAGHRIVLEGLRGSDFFLIVEGTAAVVADGHRVATLGPGGFFGEIAVLDEGERSATVRAETSLHCLVLPNGKLGDLVREHPQVGVNLLRALASRLRGMTARGQPARAEVGRG